MKMSTKLAYRITAREMGRTGMGQLLRQQAGLSLRQVGKEVGASASSVLYWETGRMQPKSDAGLRWGQLMIQLREVRS